MFGVVLLGAGLFLLIGGSLISGGKSLNLDSVFSRIAGALFLVGFFSRYTGSYTLLIVVLTLAVASLLISLIRGVTR